MKEEDQEFGEEAKVDQTGIEPCNENNMTHQPIEENGDTATSIKYLRTKRINRTWKRVNTIRLEIRIVVVHSNKMCNLFTTNRRQNLRISPIFRAAI